MENDDIAASKIAEICLNKCGFMRNLQPILETLEEQIYGNGGAINADDFETSDDYVNMQYGGITRTSLDIIKDGQVNRNLDCQFTETEIAWLEYLAIEGKLRLDTIRRDYAVHHISMVLDIPISPTKPSSEKIRTFVRLKDVMWQSSVLSVDARTKDDDVEKANKAHTMYSLS